MLKKNKNYKLIIGLIIGIVLAIPVVYSMPYFSSSSDASYDNSNTWLTSTTVQGALDELYRQNGCPVGKSCISYVPPFLPNNSSSTAVMDNVKSTYVTSSTGINFSNSSSNSNGKGLYIYSLSSKDEYPIYYYRGTVDNNNVLFANFCWKIVRTTQTGGTKLIYNGVPSDGKCTNTTGTATRLAATSKFRSNYSSPAHVGYMSGAVYSSSKIALSNLNENYLYSDEFIYSGGTYRLQSATDLTGYTTQAYCGRVGGNGLKYTCFSTSTSCSSLNYIYDKDACTDDFSSVYVYYISLTGGKDIKGAMTDMLDNSTNTSSSAIKTAIDNWYLSNMTGYTSYLEDTTWCNDKVTYDEFGTHISFAPYNRTYNKRSLSLTCNKNDAYTVNNTINGNGKLTYPVALLTADEVRLAGVNGGGSSSNSSYYLYTNESWWTMSPSYFEANMAKVYYVIKGGGLRYGGTTIDIGVRPAISLKNGIKFTVGDGTKNSPYKIS